MVTSSISGEGKSTNVMDLANSFKDLGNKVLVIDADMRKSMMKHYLVDKNDAHYGLSHVLTRQCRLSEAIYKTDTGTYVILAGPTPPNPSELLSTDILEKVLDKVREYYDYILIDCPPLGAVVDAAVVANLCDGAIVVVEAGKIPYKVVQGVVKQLKQTTCPILGVVLNKVDLKKKGRYYKNYYYKKYGYYAKDDRPHLETDDTIDDIEFEDI